MKKVILLLCSIVLSDSIPFAQQCFIPKEQDRVLKSEGKCTSSYASKPKFKIALSLIGFDSRILKSKNEPSHGLC